MWGRAGTGARRVKMRNTGGKSVKEGFSPHRKKKKKKKIEPKKDLRHGGVLRRKSNGRARGAGTLNGEGRRGNPRWFSCGGRDASSTEQPAKGTLCSGKKPEEGSCLLLQNKKKGHRAVIRRVDRQQPQRGEEESNTKNVPVTG